MRVRHHLVFGGFCGQAPSNRGIGAPAILARSRTTVLIEDRGRWEIVHGVGALLHCLRCRWYLTLQAMLTPMMSIWFRPYIFDLGTCLESCTGMRSPLSMASFSRACYVVLKKTLSGLRTGHPIRPRADLLFSLNRFPYKDSWSLSIGPGDHSFSPHSFLVLSTSVDT